MLAATDDLLNYRLPITKLQHAAWLARPWWPPRPARCRMVVAMVLSMRLLGDNIATHSCVASGDLQDVTWNFTVIRSPSSGSVRFTKHCMPCGCGIMHYDTLCIILNMRAFRV
jgi:hypothetical protein